MKQARKYLSLFFLAVITLAIAPKEMLHAFHEHDETEHEHSHSGVVLEEAHTHCSILQTESPVFVTDPVGFHFSVTTLSSSFLVPAVAGIHNSRAAAPSLRGPPVC